MGAPKIEPFLTEEADPETEAAMRALLETDHSGGGHDDGEGVWLLSYSDLMTLLMGFFALLTSMGNFDEEKFVEISDQTARHFGGEVEEPYKELGQALQKIIDAKGLSDQVQTKVLKTGIHMTFEGTLFFDSGSVALKEGAEVLMGQIVEILKEQAKQKKFLVEGHTDDVPIQKGLVASNWELSALRAGAVARMFERRGFERLQIMTIGLGETRPLVSNQDSNGQPIEINRSKNRRVVLKILDRLPL